MIETFVKIIISLKLMYIIRSRIKITNIIINSNKIVFKHSVLDFLYFFTFYCRFCHIICNYMIDLVI